ncbi:DoxX family protein [Nocardia paucivorans]|uniref:DoxX family protein n=1 Tax=Nocardia paucivorans TaxID=114259 RepID=UPI000311840C|nr:MauE/DoxX family redox-associated membrane protein [Nocardia paucivorans]
MTAVVPSTDALDIGRGPALRLAGLLIVAGVLHFSMPKFFDSIVPRILPGAARTYTYLSGVAEVGVGAALVAPRTRRLGGLLAALLFIAVFPANIQHTVDTVGNPKASRSLKVISVLRLPMQLPLITQALAVRHG